MHFAKVESSDRLKRVLDVLADGLPHSTLEIQRKAKVCAVGSSVSELRSNGYRIECKRSGKGFFQYQLLGGSK